MVRRCWSLPLFFDLAVVQGFAWVRDFDFLGNEPVRFGNGDCSLGQEIDSLLQRIVVGFTPFVFTPSYFVYKTLVSTLLDTKRCEKTEEEPLQMRGGRC